MIIALAIAFILYAAWLIIDCKSDFKE